MLRPLFTILDKIIKISAGQYVQSIKVDSLPLWRGEVVVEDFKINCDGVNKMLAEMGIEVRVFAVDASKLKVIAPVFSAGKSPLQLHLHSLSIDVEMGNYSKSQSTSQENEASLKIFENIAVHIDGFAVKVKYKIGTMELLVSNVEGHLTPTENIFSGNQIRMFLTNSKTTVDFLIREGTCKQTKTDTIINCHDMSVENTMPKMDVTVEMGTAFVVRSSTPIHITFPWESWSYKYTLMMSVPFYSHGGTLVPMWCYMDSLAFTFKVDQTISFTLDLGKIEFASHSYTVGPCSLTLNRVDKHHVIIDDLMVTGELNQIKQRLIYDVIIETMKITVPLERDLLDLLGTLQFPPPDEIPPTKIDVEQKTVALQDIAKINNRIIDFQFESPIVPIAFEIPDCENVKILLRVKEDCFRQFIALASMETCENHCSFIVKEEHRVPGKHWQLVFPSCVTPTIFESAKFTYFNSDHFSLGKDYLVKVKNGIIELESYDMPVAFINLNDFQLSLSMGPFGQLHSGLELGLSIMLTNFRNSTASSIIDIPHLFLHYTNFPDFCQFLPEPKNIPKTALKTKTVQEAYKALSASLSLRIPEFTMNVVPTMLVDFARFLVTLQPTDIIAYKIQNKSDAPFSYQVGNTMELTTISAGENQIITFDPGQIHSIFFPTQSTRIIFNQTGFYQLSETNYAKVDLVNPFTFSITLFGSTQFYSDLKMPIELNISNRVVAINDGDMCSCSFLSGTVIELSFRSPDITNWSNQVNFVINNQKQKIQYFGCDVLNMLPPNYLCAPQLTCLIVPKQKSITCLNGMAHTILEFHFLPLLKISNGLETPIFTSAGPVPEKSTRDVAFLQNSTLVIDDHVIPVSYPLWKSQPISMIVNDIPSIIDSTPSLNTVSISPSFIFHNDATVRLSFQIGQMDPVLVDSGMTKFLREQVELDMLKVGIFEDDVLRWSEPLPIPTKRDFEIKCGKGKAHLWASVSEFNAIISGKLIAVNESDRIIWIAPSTKLEIDGQAQLLVWNTVKKFAQFGFDQRNFGEPVPLSIDCAWVRQFLKNDGDFQYLTYSVQASSDPQTVVIHTDVSPPFRICNSTDWELVVRYEHNVDLVLHPKRQIFLPTIPHSLPISQFGSSSFGEISLEFEGEMIFEDFYLKVERKCNQARLTISDQKSTLSKPKKRFSFSLFANQILVSYFDEICQPGIPHQAFAFTAQSASLEIVNIENEILSIKFLVDVLQIDNVGDFHKFPVILQKIGTQPFLVVQIELCYDFGNIINFNKTIIRLSPLIVNVEENVVHFILGYIALIPPTPPVPKSNTKYKIHPRFYKELVVDPTRVMLSVSTKSLLQADFRNVELNMSEVRVDHEEMFDFYLVQLMMQHYTADVLAAIPSMVASLSLIGSPVNLVNQSIEGMKNFVNEAFYGGDSLLEGIGKGSLSLMRNISKGALESFVGFASSMEQSVSKLQKKPDTNVGDFVATVSEVVSIGAHEFNDDRLTGMARGAGVGVLGVITMPTVALFSFLSRAGETLLQKVNGDEREVKDQRIEKKQHELPTLVLSFEP